MRWSQFMLQAFKQRAAQGWTAWVLLITALTLLAGCSDAPQAIAFSPIANEARPHRLFAVSHGWHVGLVLPAAPLAARLPALKERFANASHFEIGWGDKGFYQSEEITASLILQAMFSSTGAVMHVVSLPPSADTPFDTFSSSEVVEFCASERELASLNAFVEKSFLKSGAGQLISTKPGIYGNSQFYEATGKFHMLNTCNKWVAKGLVSMGVGVDHTFALTAGNLLGQLKSSGRVVRSAANGVKGVATANCR
jgi:uncharacterized protein (TIGR02117 family)